MPKPRVLVLAEACNPEWTSVPLIGWAHAQVLREVAHVHLVTQIRNRDALMRAGLAEGDDFTAIDSEAIARPAYKLATLLRGGEGRGWTVLQTFSALTYGYFERLVWNRFSARLRAREFDIVHRITPVSPTATSVLSHRCRKIGVPFVLGPINGGVPWPKEFAAAQQREREWLSSVRNLHRLRPAWRKTMTSASAVIAGSLNTYRELQNVTPNHCLYIPENAIDPENFPQPEDRPAFGPLKAVFVGRLVPCKGVDMLIEAAAPLLATRQMELTIVGDGPESANLHQLATTCGVSDRIQFPGWIPQKQVHHHLGEADIFTFPSIREFGGGAVLEAMAMGAVPVIVNYAGPPELATEDCSFHVELGRRERLVKRLRETLTQIAADRDTLLDRRNTGITRARTLFTWSAKARQISEVYRWLLGQRSAMPDFGMPFHNPTFAQQPSLLAGAYE